jgi:phage-related minor tail protein
LGDTKGIDDSVDDVNSKLGMLGTGAKVALGAAGAAGGAALSLGIKNSLEIGDAQAKLKAQLGTSGPLFEDAGKIAGSLYANAYGESLGEVSDAVKTVIQSGALDMSTATNEEIQSITGQAMSLSSVFGQDVTGAMNAVAQMIRTGLAPNAQVALDILARGFQVGNDKAGDLLDTFNEYSTQFRKLGLDGQTAMGLIQQGLQAGARDADIVADAIKEFSIRAIDGSDSTKDAFKSLGLSADDMTQKLAAGGPTASAAFQTVLDKLRSIKDPAEQSRIAVELFGTQAEDLGAALYALDPSKAVATLGEVAGAAKRLDDAAGSSAQAKITAMQRGFEQWTASIVAANGPLGSLAAGVMAFAPGGIDIVGNLGMIAVAMRSVGIASFFTSGAASAAWAAITGPVGIVIGVIAAVAAGAYLIYRNWDTIKEFFSSLWSTVAGIISGAWNWIVGLVQGGIDRAKGYIYWLAGLGGMVANWFGGMVSAAAGQINSLIGWVAGIPGRVLGALGNLAGLLFGAGVSLISGFLNGLVARWNQLMAWARSAMAQLRALWPFSPAKEGPFSGRGYVTYSGQALTSDFAKSIVAGVPTVLDAVRGLMGAAQGEMVMTPLVPLQPAATGAGQGGVARLVIDSAGSRIDDILVEVLKAAIRERGGNPAVLGV